VGTNRRFGDGPFGTREVRQVVNPETGSVAATTDGWGERLALARRPLSCPEDGSRQVGKSVSR
jgi:hypothetical protein